ncbi:MAG: primosomal protein N' [Clostridia bacterium]|nr:primosomal protein N' [Clostridia bacterium]
MKFATVKLLSLPFHVPNGYDYIVPDDGFVGAFVTVPLGASNKVSLGVITKIHDATDSDISYKQIDHVYEKEYSLTPVMLGLAEYIEETTLCSFGDAVRAVFPVSVLGTVKEYYEPTDKIPEGLNDKVTAVYAYVASNPGVSGRKMTSEFGSTVTDALRYLCRNGHLRRTAVAEENTNVAYDEFYLCADKEGKTKSPKMNAAIAYLAEHGRTEKTALCEKTGVTPAALKTLVERGILTLEKCERYRTPYLTETAKTAVSLTEEQEKACGEVAALCEKNEPAAALLFGVTGSGKTLVIKSICDRVIASGKRVIMLVPEISLTPQSVRIFSSYYGDRIAVLHSSLSEGERLDAWKRIRRGEADMVIGTRSASFAPVPNLGLFVIDEEQEHTYKSDSSPKYRAKDVARYRCAKENAVMLLSSATPSVESYYLAMQGKYKLIKLGSRYGKARLPEVVVADLRKDAAEGRIGPIGSTLQRLLEDNVENGNQSVLFLNRRGYNRYLSCKMCGEVIMCPHCDVSLTYHKRKDNAGYLMCHYCGYRIPEPETCPKCGSPHIGHIGYGTQKIDEELSVMLPGARVLRMDADTTTSKSAYDRILGDFRAHRADVLLGTQMVTKGHDFPDVTLVGVVMADNSLYLDDYHAQERTFSLLTQVIGRAGRADKPGVAVIQTLNPDHDIITYAKAQDYERFYKGEIRMREALLFPPFCDLLLLSFTSEDEELLKRSSEDFKRMLEYDLQNEHKDVKMLIYGPCEMQIYRINGVCRMQILCKFRSGKRSRAVISALMKRFISKYPRRVTVSADINPNQM